VLNIQEKKQRKKITQMSNSSTNARNHFNNWRKPCRRKRKEEKKKIPKMKPDFLFNIFTSKLNLLYTYLCLYNHTNLKPNQF